MRNMISIFIDLNERWQNYQFQVYNISGRGGGRLRGVKGRVCKARENKIFLNFL